MSVPSISTRLSKLIRQVYRRDHTRSRSLLIPLLLLLFLSPFLGDWRLGDLIGNLLLTSITAASLYTIREVHKSVPAHVLVLAGLSLAVNWLSSFLVDGWQVVRLFLNLLFFVEITLRLIRQISSAKDVSANTIYTAISGYVLLGFTGALLATSIEVLQPDSFAFNVDAPNQTANFQGMLYFSLITLTTIGYGDITPLSPLARSFAILLGLAGQMYLTIIVALLVGKFLNGQGQA